MNAEVTRTVIEDYRLEEFLRCPYRYAKRQEAAPSAKAEVNWIQLAQLAVSYVVHDFFTAPKDQRVRLSIPDRLEHWWTNKVVKFESAEHYWSVKQRLLERLQDVLKSDHASSPILLFEQHQVFVPELEVELRQIFQLVLSSREGGPSDYIVRKYIVDDDENIITLYQHLTAVFCASAFGRLPEWIEQQSVLSGKCHVMRPTEESLRHSQDYMKLVVSLMRETTGEPGPLRKQQGSAECRRCPFQEECMRLDDKAVEAIVM